MRHRRFQVSLYIRIFVYSRPQIPTIFWLSGAESAPRGGLAAVDAALVGGPCW